MVSPAAKAMIREPNPEPNPFITTICSGFFEDSILVQLFSKPQQTQASITKREPREKEKLLISSMERRMLARVMSPMAAHSRLEMVSLKNHKAIIEVVTISKLLSREAFAAVVLVSPSIRNMGAPMSRITMPAV